MITSKAQHDNSPHHHTIILDDLGIDSPKTQYNPEEFDPGIRRLVMEHISTQYRVLAENERAAAIFCSLKSLWYNPGIKIVEFVGTKDRRIPDKQTVENLVRWLVFGRLRVVWAGLVVATYDLISVHEFSVVAVPLFDLQRKNLQ